MFDNYSIRDVNRAMDRLVADLESRGRMIRPVLRLEATRHPSAADRPAIRRMDDRANSIAPASGSPTGHADETNYSHSNPERKTL